MDPISQAAFGASLSQSFASDRSKQLYALIVGALAGMAPDLDVLIQSSHDSLLFLEFHRQFTHSLIFIPVGALICALFFYPFVRKKLSFKQNYLFALLGYATHGLLDACTSYGTLLLWPFSNERFAWNTVSIVDPLFTLPVLILIVLAASKKKVLYARLAFVYAVVYLLLGIVQYQRAEQAVQTLAEQRGHLIERMHLKPSFGNRHVWKLLYEYDGRYYIDAVRLLWNKKIIQGTSIQKLDVKRDFPWLPENSQQAKDIERFRWFSDGYLALSTQNPNIITDVRYSFLPNRVNPMWGIELDKQKIDEGKMDVHADYLIIRNSGKNMRWRFIEMVF